MDQYRDPGDCGQKVVRLREPVAIPHLDPRRDLVARVAVGVVGRDDDPRDALGLEHSADVSEATLAGWPLAPGHGHGAVEEQLESDVDAGVDGSLDRELTAVEEGAVTEVLGEMSGVDELGHPDPGCPLVAHRRDTHDLTDPVIASEQRHRVAANPRADQSPFRHAGGSVVRAPRAEGRRSAVVQREEDSFAGRRWRNQARTEAVLERGPQWAHHAVGQERAETGHLWPAGAVKLSGDQWLIGRAVEGVANQSLERWVHLFDDHHLFEAGRERADHRRVERDRHSHLQDAHSCRCKSCLVETETPEGIQRLEVGEARRDHSEPGRRRRNRDPVELVGHAVGDRHVGAHAPKLLLDLEGVRRKQQCVRTALIGLAIDGRHDRSDPVGVQPDRARPVRHRRHDFEPDPEPACSRQRDRVSTQIEGLRHVGGIQDRQVQVDHRRVRRRRDRR